MRRAYGLVEHLLIAAIAFVPALVVKPGIETSDTKTYLYLDPGRFLHQVATMWDPSVALGTVTHEYIGYLFPMGPFFWFFSGIGAPVWVAQRLWLGSILFAAGAGTTLLGRTFNLRAPGRTVAALAFMLSPYFLQYAGRISVILLPWAGLPFMVAFAARALRRGGWRYPALFALVVAATSGINASSIIYVAVAPVLWLVFAVVVLRETTWAKVGTAAAKMAVLTGLTCLWWVVGLVVEAGFGVDVLRYTETLPATSETSSAAEVIRGLGYWYFYGGDRLGPWTQSAVVYTQQLWLLAVSYLVPVLAFVSAIFVRWRERTYFVLLVVVGMVLSVGAYPYTDPTPVGGALKSFMSHTTAGLALRSTDRATPLVVLGLAMLLGAGISAIRVRVPLMSAAAALLATAAIVAANPALFNGDAEVASFFTQPAKLPGYEMSAISYLNSTHPGTRVLSIPGDNFASYRWGDTVDTPQPAFLNRPFVTREQQIMGSIATADTLFATDNPIQSGTEQWDSLAPMARLMSAGDLLVEYDQRYEHYGVPDPQVLASELSTTPAGLSGPVTFGSPRPNVSSYADVDGRLVSLTPAQSNSWPSPLVDYTVDDPRPITRAESDAGSILVAGDATALEEMAGLGMLDTDSAIYYSGSLDENPQELQRLVADGASLVLTDTNRKQAFRWDTITANSGSTETPSQDTAGSDPSDFPIELFPGRARKCEDDRLLRRRCERHRFLLRKSRLVHARIQRLWRDRRQRRHELEHRNSHVGSGRAMVAGLVRKSCVGQPGEPGSASERRHLPLDNEGHLELRRCALGDRRPRSFFADDHRSGSHFSCAAFQDIARHYRLDERRPHVTGLGNGRRFRRGGDPRAARHPGGPDAERPSRRRRKLLSRQPADGRHVARQGVGLLHARPKRSRDEHLARVLPTDRAVILVVGWCQSLEPHTRRRDRPSRG